jgi:hypothetical protein
MSTMRRCRAARPAHLVAAMLTLVGSQACSASGERASSDDSSGSDRPGAASTAGRSTTPTIDIDIDVSTGSGGSAAVTDAGCQHVEVSFVPKVPTVFVLVDRSDSMFVPNSATQVTSWDPLKAGVLSVIGQLQGQIRFGFGAFSGQQAGVCPIFDAIAPALDNAAAISAVYQPLTKLTGVKGETPVTQVLPLVQDLLSKEPSDGGKYILLVTDGEPDFCDDGDPRCPVDALVGRVQRLASAGTKTIVFGLKSEQSALSDVALQAVANAGASEAVVAPFAGNASADVCTTCSSRPGWLAEWASLGTTPSCTAVGKQVLGSYGPAAGNAVVYHPDPTDQAALTQQIASAISGVKSCVFDLGGDITVNLNLLAEASVSIEGQSVPQSNDNGWRMNTSTQLELVGAACASWQNPQSTKIDFNFPCDIIVPK